MSNKENKKGEAFRQVDKNTRDAHVNEEVCEALKERSDEHSDTIRRKGAEAREIIDSQSYGRRKGQKLNSPQ